MNSFIKHKDSPYQPSASVTVIIPCFRCVDTIERAVESVFNQTLRPLELFLIDDCSGDGTLEILYCLQEKYPKNWIKVIALPQNSGPGAARNAGWDVATGEYIAFLDADDAWHPQKIEIQYKWMADHPDVVFTGHYCQVILDQKLNFTQLEAAHQHFQFRPTNCFKLLLANQFYSPNIMIHRKLPHRFTPDKRYAEDYLLWLEICLDGYPCGVIPLTLAFLFKPHYGEGGLSGKLWQMERGELDTYHRLVVSKRIGHISFLGLALLSLVKFAKRVFVVWARKSIFRSR